MRPTPWSKVVGEPVEGGTPPARRPAGRRDSRGQTDAVGARAAEIAGELGDLPASERPRVAARVAAASIAYARDSYEEALRDLKGVVLLAPSAPTARELYGLTLYRVGRWQAAARQLSAFHRLTGSFDQHPVIADCHRALGHSRRVEEVYEELRRSSPSPDLQIEGRLVLAGARADRGDLEGAITVLAPAPPLRHPATRHVRLWYVLADLYERAGDIPRAREHFARIVRHDPGAYDAAERLSSLS